jgi:hypothetical protein
LKKKLIKRFFNGFFFYFEKLGKYFIQEKLPKIVRQEAFLLETFSRMIAIVLGPSIGQVIYTFFDSNFAVASMHLSGINFIFTVVFFCTFILPNFFRKPRVINKEEIQIKHEIKEGITEIVQNIKPVQDIITKVKKITSVKKNLRYLSKSFS